MLKSSSFKSKNTSSHHRGQYWTLYSISIILYINDFPTS